MSLIGILTENKNEAYLKKIIEQKELENVFFLNEKSIDNVRNIKFETFLLGKKVEKKQDIVRGIAKKASYFILNSDIKENLSILDNLDLMLITYGYNQKATITASSVEENKMLICLQRNIKNIYKQEIEPQEILLDNYKEIEDYTAMELASLIVLYKKENN